MAHPLGHQGSADLDPVAQVDRLLTVKRKTVGIFGDRDKGEQPFRWQSGFDDVCRCERLDHAVMATEGIFGTARHDDPELRRNDIEPFGTVFADQHLLQALISSGEFRLDDLLDALKMRSKAFARAWSAFRLVPGAPVEFALDARKAGLHLLEGKGNLLVVEDPRTTGAEPFRALAMLRALQDLHDQRQVGNPLVGALFDRLQPGDFSLRGS